MSNIKMNIWLPDDEHHNEFREAGDPRTRSLPGVRLLTPDVQIMPSRMQVPCIELEVHGVREEILERFPFDGSHFGYFRTKYWKPINPQLKVTFYT